MGLSPYPQILQCLNIGRPLFARIYSRWKILVEPGKSLFLSATVEQSRYLRSRPNFTVSGLSFSFAFLTVAFFLLTSGAATLRTQPGDYRTEPAASLSLHPMAEPQGDTTPSLAEVRSPCIMAANRRCLKRSQITCSMLASMVID